MMVPVKQAILLVSFGRNQVMDKETYIKKLAAWSRADLLKVCRAAGITANKVKTNEDLALLLWERVGKHRWEGGKA
jgi:hypothetical protein